MITDDDIKSKLLILFILEKCEMAIKEDILCTMCCTDNNWIPYFCFGHFVEELTTTEFISVLNDPLAPGEKLLSITEKGKVCLNFFYSNIFRSLRDDASEYIRENKIKYRRMQEYVCQTEELPGGTFRVHLKALNGTQVMFELSFEVPTKRKADSIAVKWRENAPKVYENYRDLMIDD